MEICLTKMIEASSLHSVSEVKLVVNGLMNGSKDVAERRKLPFGRGCYVADNESLATVLIACYIAKRRLIAAIQAFAEWIVSARQRLLDRGYGLGPPSPCSPRITMLYRADCFRFDSSSLSYSQIQTSRFRYQRNTDDRQAPVIFLQGNFLLLQFSP